MRLSKERVIVAGSWMWIVAWTLGWMFSPARDFASSDYTMFVEQWVYYIRGHGYHHALGDWFSNYMPFYSYMLLPVALIPGNPLWGVKLITALFNIAMGYTAGAIVAAGYQKGKERWIKWPVAAIVTSLPTVTAQAFLWAQCDSIYVTFALGCILMLIKRRGNMAMVMMGMALSMKLQSIFIAPVIYYMLLRKQLRWSQLLIVPAVMIAVCLPAMLAGRPVSELLAVYPTQCVQYRELSFGYPNIYLLLEGYLTSTVTKQVMVTLTAAATLAAGWIMAKRGPAKITPGFLACLTLVCGVVYPFILPGMHSRYMIIGEVMAVPAAFYHPRWWWLALLLDVITVPCYLNFLAGTHIDILLLVPLMTILVVATVTLFLRYYFRDKGSTSRHQQAP